MLNPIMTIIIAIMALIPSVLGVAIRSESLDLPYPRGDVQFTGTIGGYSISHNGSVQEIFSRIATEYPDFDPEAAVAQSRSINRALNPRGKYPGNVICIPVPGWEWIDATTWYVRQDIAFLNALGGTWNIGPRTCARIACDGNSAIFLCNDNYHSITPDCWYMGSYATDLINDCTYNALGGPFTGGQEFDSDGYNVIVREDQC